MPDHVVNVLGIDLAFKADASSLQVEAAKSLVESRFEKLQKSGRLFSREKLLTFLALGLADDLIQAEKQASVIQERMQGMLAEIEEKA
jgi:cell division protein ZapA